MGELNITSIQFNRFKGLKRFSIVIKKNNILVGPNNCGKSTIISAFRLLDIGLRFAKRRKAVLINEYGINYGHYLPANSIPLSLENVHTDYDESISEIIFNFTHNLAIVFVFPPQGGCLMTCKDLKSSIEYELPNQIKKIFDYEVLCIPILGPIEHEENIINLETIKQALNTHRASRHFRNYWYQLGEEESFEEFSTLVKNTWDGMTINRPESNGCNIYMFCEENRITRELYWAGFGFQIWCQLLTYLIRAKEANIIIVDEPDIYLHPDMQRKLINIIKDTKISYVLATHSTEIMSEADPADMLLIDKNKQSAKRLNDIESVQSAIENIGSIQNITLTHLARTNRILFVEGMKDYKIIKRFAKKLGYSDVYSGNGITAFESGGYAAKERIQSFAWGFKKTLDSDLKIYAVFDRDYFCDEEIVSNINEIEKASINCHFHERKEIENYLLEPKALTKAINKSIVERNKQLDEKIEFNEDINKILDNLSKDMENKVLSQIVAKHINYLGRRTGIDDSTITNNTLKNFDSKWSELYKRLYIVSGKELIKLLRGYINDKYKVSFSDQNIIDSFDESDIPQDIIELVKELENFRIK